MDLELILAVSAAFVSIAGITFSVGHMIASRNRLQRRLPATFVLTPGDGVGTIMGETSRGDRFGLGEKLSRELRLKLVRAGYFSPDAARIYVLARVGAVIAAPLLVLLGGVFFLRDLSTLSLVLIAAAIWLALSHG